MTNLQMWSLIVGTLLPLVVAVVQRRTWPDWLRSAIMVAVSALAAAGTAYFQGDLTGRRFVEAGLVIIVATIATYQGLWKPTGVAPAIEAKTGG